MYEPRQHDIAQHPSPSQPPLSALPPEQPVSLSTHSTMHPAVGSSASPRSASIFGSSPGLNEQSIHCPQAVTGWNGSSESSGPREPFIENTSRLEQSGRTSSVPIIIQGPSVPFGFKSPFPSSEASSSTNQSIEPWFYSPVSPAPSVYPVYSGSKILDDVAPLADDADEWTVWSRSEAAVTIVPPSLLKTVCKRCFDHRVECSWPGADGAGACSNCFFSYSLCKVVQPASLDHSICPTLKSIPSTDSLDMPAPKSTHSLDVPISVPVLNHDTNLSNPVDPKTSRAHSASLPVPSMAQPSTPSSTTSRIPDSNRSLSPIVYPSRHPTTISPSRSLYAMNSQDRSQSIDSLSNSTFSDQAFDHVAHRPFLPTPQASSTSGSTVSKTASPDPVSIDSDRPVFFRETGRNFSPSSSLPPSLSRDASFMTSSPSSRPYSTTESSVRNQSDAGLDTRMIELFDRVVRLQSDATAGLVQVRSALQETEASSSVPPDKMSRKKEKKKRRRELQKEKRKERELESPMGNIGNESKEQIAKEDSRKTAQISTAGSDKGGKSLEDRVGVDRLKDGIE